MSTSTSTNLSSRKYVDDKRTTLEGRVATLEGEIPAVFGRINNAVETAEAAKNDAVSAKRSAESNANAASSAKTVAVDKAAEASQAKTDAETAKTCAEQAKTDALAARAGAESAKSEALDAKTLAVQAKNDAQEAAENAAEAAYEAAKRMVDQLVRMVKVAELPQQGEPRTIYLVPRAESETGNLYDEYIWTSGAWEKIGSTDIDLSGYVEKTRKINGKALSADVTLDASDVWAATSAQGAKADTAIQTVKVNGTALVPDGNKAVDVTIPAPAPLDDAVTRTSANGVKSSGIWPAIWGDLSALPTGSTSLYGWVVSQLNSVVHTSGNEVIDGTKTFAKQVVIANGKTLCLSGNSPGGAGFPEMTLSKSKINWGGSLPDHFKTINFPSSSGTFALLQNIGIETYESGKKYADGNLVHTQNAICRCIVVESSATWIAAEWLKLFDTTGTLAPLASPAFTGTPTAPDIGANTSSQVATKTYVDDAVAGATPNLDYVMRVDPETGNIYYTTPDEQA